MTWPLSAGPFCGPLTLQESPGWVQKVSKESRKSLRSFKTVFLETPETLPRLFRTLFGPRRRTAQETLSETLRGFLAQRSRETPVRVGRDPNGIPKNTAFMRTSSKSSRELLPSSLCRESGTQRKLFRKTCSDFFFWVDFFRVDFPPLLGCRKWGCNKWGLKGRLAALPGNRPKSAFFALFLPFSPSSGGCEEHLENPENG